MSNSILGRGVVSKADASKVDAASGEPVARERSLSFAVLMAVLGLAIAASGCHSAPVAPPKAVDIAVRVVASPQLNPDGAGRPSPILLEIDQLRDGSAFGAADFDALALHRRATLGGTLIANRELIVEPGTATTLTLAIRPETELLGIVAQYRDLAQSKWRAMTPARAAGLLAWLQDHSLTIHLGARSVTITAAAARKRKGWF